MIKKRVVKSAAIALMASALFVVPTMAYDYGFSFNVEIAEDTSDVAYSGNAYKENDNDYAFVDCQKSNIYSNDDFRFCVVGQQGDNSDFSEQVRATANTGTYYLNYIRPTYYDNMYRLRGRTYSWYVSASGVWNP